MRNNRSFDLPEELAAKLDDFAKQQGKSTQTLLTEIVSDYIEVTEFILRKKRTRKASRREPKIPRT
jgi:predicted DNA-binding protein